jgi:hypothetical protein
MVKEKCTVQKNNPLFGHREREEQTVPWHAFVPRSDSSFMNSHFVSQFVRKQESRKQEIWALGDVVHVFLSCGVVM